jgi:hypothetical protein
MKVTTCLSVDQPNDIAVSNKAQIASDIIVRLLTIGINEPVVVGIFMVVTGDLLLLRSFWEGLHMRVKKSSAVSHVFERDSRPNCQLKGAVSADLSASQVGLEEGAHLGIARATVCKNQKVHIERQHVNQDWNDNQSYDANHNVLCKYGLSMCPYVSYS